MEQMILNQTQEITHRFYFKTGTSRGRDSYGYNIVSLYVDGVKVAMSVGVGFDQVGSCFGQFLTERYNDRLKALPANYGSLDDNKGFYGLCHNEKITYNQLHYASVTSKTYCNGMCGRSSMMAIAKAIGVSFFETQAPRRSRR